MKFKPGDRVRLVRPWENMVSPVALYNWARLQNQEGTVVRLGAINQRGTSSVAVLFDNVLNEDGFDGTFCCPEYGLEPIVKGDQNTITTWDECPWKPEHIREEELELVRVR